MRALVLSLLLCSPALAYADAMPSCPQGTHLETQPGSNGHHGGGRCVQNPGGCSIRPTSHARTPLVLLALAALALVRRGRAER